MGRRKQQEVQLVSSYCYALSFRFTHQKNPSPACKIVVLPTSTSEPYMSPCYPLSCSVQRLRRGAMPPSSNMTASSYMSAPWLSASAGIATVAHRAEAQSLCGADVRNVSTAARSHPSPSLEAPSLVSFLNKKWAYVASAVAFGQRSASTASS